MNSQTIPIDTRKLFGPLQSKLVLLLNSLGERDWDEQTVAKHWKVKDVASHILDTQLRVLSIQRDGFFGETPPEKKEYVDIVNWLNQLNADWVAATRRLSPKTLILLLELVGNQVIEYYQSLDPWSESTFPVAWAGESTSFNWMHLAREYTEYWHHQQQIRDAVNQQAIMNREFFHPVISTFLQALPNTFRKVRAKEGTQVSTHITGEAGGTWHLTKGTQGWNLGSATKSIPDAFISIPAEYSWVLFSKSIRPDDIRDKITVQGNTQLANGVLEMVSVMA